MFFFTVIGFGLFWPKFSICEPGFKINENNFYMKYCDVSKLVKTDCMDIN